ncbi:hypothetical protein C8J57DRAFT_1498895 [Mycena rebaudengoi]|nr:hypothetical protein C8J57DRAFT_1498895 [Mycena rebaudengoi]
MLVSTPIYHSDEKKLSRRKWDPPKKPKLVSQLLYIHKLKQYKLRKNPQLGDFTSVDLNLLSPGPLYYPELDALEENTRMAEFEAMHKVLEAITGRTQDEKEAISSLAQLAGAPMTATDHGQVSGRSRKLPTPDSMGHSSNRKKTFSKRSADYDLIFPPDLPPSSEDEEDAAWRLGIERLSHNVLSTTDPSAAQKAWNLIAPAYQSSECESEHSLSELFSGL